MKSIRYNVFNKHDRKTSYINRWTVTLNILLTYSSDFNKNAFPISADLPTSIKIPGRVLQITHQEAYGLIPATFHRNNLLV